MAKYFVVIESSDDLQLKTDTGSPNESVQTICQFLDKACLGCAKTATSVDIQTDGVAASGTVTFASLANDNTITLGGTVFTAKTSGAAGAVQFNLGADDTEAAANAVVVINAHTTIGTIVTATSDGAVITLTAKESGAIGNQFTTAISANGSVSGSGRLTSGTNRTAHVMTL
jgi:hypothetical protein